MIMSHSPVIKYVEPEPIIERHEPKITVLSSEPFVEPVERIVLRTSEPVVHHYEPRRSIIREPIQRASTVIYSVPVRRSIEPASTIVTLAPPPVMAAPPTNNVTTLVDPAYAPALAHAPTMYVPRKSNHDVIYSDNIGGHHNY